MNAYTSTPRNWDQVKRHPAVDYVEVQPGEEARYWIYLREGFIASGALSVPRAVGNGSTIREAIEDTFPAVPRKAAE